MTKAAIKHSSRTGKKRSLFFVVAVLLCLLALVNFMSNQPEYSTTLQQIEQTSKNGAKNDVAVIPFDGDPFYPKGNSKPSYIFHHTPGGRTGKEGHVVLDMIMAHAYSFHQGQLYGGSCGPGNDVGRDPENSLIKAIGLSDVLRFQCPSELTTKFRKKEIPSKDYQADGVRQITPEYVTLLKSVVKYPEKDQNQYTIVVHISRDKFTPCRRQYKDYDPYLPNKHYQMLIDKYMKANAKVKIYSQENSFESFDEFREKGYELHIDEPIADVWRAAMNADVFIMSRSRFSYAPAVVTKATVVYTPFWDKPLRGWEIVKKDVLEQSQAEFNRLKATCKESTNKLLKFRRPGRQ